MYNSSQQASGHTEQQPILTASNINRSFRSGNTTIQILHNINMHINAGEFVTLQGRSGSGKSTLLNILVGLDNPDQGEVEILGHALRTLNESKRAILRREKAGLLFQNAHLIPALTAQENVEIALRLQRLPARERKNLASNTLERVGLKDKTEHRATELSGGEQQRVALARALVHQPRLLIADEPTGNLDSRTAHSIIHLLHDIISQTGVGLLVATHDTNVVHSADRTLHIHDGTIM